MRRLNNRLQLQIRDNTRKCTMLEVEVPLDITNIRLMRSEMRYKWWVLDWQINDKIQHFWKEMNPIRVWIAKIITCILILTELSRRQEWLSGTNKVAPLPCRDTSRAKALEDMEIRLQLPRQLPNMQSINNRLEFPAQINHPTIRDNNNNSSSPTILIKDFQEAFKDKKETCRCEEVIQD